VSKKNLEFRVTASAVVLVVSVAFLAGWMSKMIAQTTPMVLSLVGISLVFSSLFWFVLRKMVISPVRAIEAAAARIAGGDLSSGVEMKGDDELGRVGRMLRESSASLGGFIARSRELSARMSRVAETMEKEAGSIVRGAEIEIEAIGNITDSTREINAGAAEIAENTEGLARSVEETSVSMDQMVSSIGTISTSIHGLSSGVDSASSSIEELSATIREVAANSEELAAAADETLSSISEISSSVKEVEQNARESARQSERVTHDAATLGRTTIEKTIEGMQQIKSSVERTADVIRRLGGRSNEIGKILVVIDDVTDQTTLLSLNAAILAAQAGEHGKGFSVVAEEIKELAERAALSTQEISSLIQSVQEEVMSAVEGMQGGIASVEEGLRRAREAGDALGTMLESSKKSAEMSRAIERSTAEQARAAKLVTDAMERVRDMISQIAKATAEEAKGISLIFRETEKMKDAARQVSLAIDEQTLSSRQISGAMELAAERGQQISRALLDHKMSSKSISNIVEGVKGIPIENRKIAFRVSDDLKGLRKDAEFLKTEAEVFIFTATERPVPAE
jgi:methyl-accepting chemotaxis protein